MDRSNKELAVYELYGTELKKRVLRPENLSRAVLSLASDILERITPEGYADLTNHVYFKISGSPGEFLIECYHRDFVLELTPWEAKNRETKEGSFPPGAAWLRVRVCTYDEEDVFEYVRSQSVVEADLYNKDVREEIDQYDDLDERAFLTCTQAQLAEHFFKLEAIRDKIIHKDMIRSAPFVFYIHEEKAVSDRIADKDLIVRLLNYIAWLLMDDDVMEKVLVQIGFFDTDEALDNIMADIDKILYKILMNQNDV